MHYIVFSLSWCAVIVEVLVDKNEVLLAVLIVELIIISDSDILFFLLGLLRSTSDDERDGKQYNDVVAVGT